MRYRDLGPAAVSRRVRIVLSGRFRLIVFHLWALIYHIRFCPSFLGGQKHGAVRGLCFLSLNEWDDGWTLLVDPWRLWIVFSC